MTEPQTPTNEEARHAMPAGLLHDLRTELDPIIGYATLLMEMAHEEGQEGFVPDLQIIQDAGKRLAAFINHNFRALTASDLPPAMETTDAEAAALHPSSIILHPSEPASRPAHGFVLVVDDIESNREVLSRRLQRQGYSVATAENGREAFDKLRADTFDLVLLDIMMPEMDGYEVLRRLKADAALRHIPVIVISAVDELDSVVRCIELGAEDYLPKPFNPTLLKARIGACLEKARLHAAERQRLEGEILEISEHERARFGQDLHDDICQQLIDIAMQNSTLAARLRRSNPAASAEAARLAALLGQTLHDTRALARGLHPVEFDTKGLMIALQELAGQVSHKLPCRLECPAPVLLADNEAAFQLYRIAQEAVTNALKHDGTRELVIGLRQEDGRVQLSVRDDGVDFSNKDRKGLGLHIMSYRARMIGATLQLRGGHGPGTEVVCSFEQAQLTSVEPEPAAAAYPEDCAAGELTANPAQGVVLVVDDLEANRDLLSRQLARQGYTFATVDNGPQALDKLRTETFDLVLLDIMMPAMDGYEVLQRLKADAALRHIPVIVISALNEMDSVVRCLKLGAEDYLPKPFNPTLLKARLGACLEKKRAHDRETHLFEQLQDNYQRMQELAADLHARNAEMARWRMLQEADLAVARSTQQGMISSALPQLDGWQFEAVYTPLIQVGGDVYGWRQLDNGVWLVWLADATGHGVAAALLTTFVAFLFNHASTSSNTAHGILARVNAEFFTVLRGHCFMTACCAVIDREGRLSFAGAGHPPLLIRRRDGTVEALASHNTLIGLDPEMEIGETVTTLASGDAALLYTDGLHSMKTTANDRGTSQTVADAFARTSGDADLLPRLMAQLVQQSDAQPFDDDLAAIALRRG